MTARRTLLRSATPRVDARIALAIASIAVGALVAACDPARPQGGDELTIVVQADRRELEAQDKALKDREQAMKAEAGELDKRIKELATSRVAADLEHRRRLDDELARAKGAQDELSRRVVQLQAQKVAIESQRTVLDGSQSSSSSTPVSVREAMVAAREAKLSSREATLAIREADLGAREKLQAQREAAILASRPDPRAADLVPAEAPKASVAGFRVVPTRDAIEGRHRKLLAEMDSRGILVSDLAAEDQPLNAQVHAARRVGDWSTASDLLSDLQKAIARLRVDQGFVEAKMVRLQGQRSNAKLAEGQRGEVEQLLRDVTASYSDGAYEKANRGLNRIAAILDASKASG